MQIDSERSNIILNYKDYKNEKVGSSAEIVILKDQITFLDKLIENNKIEKVKLTVDNKILVAKNNELEKIIERQKKEIWDYGRVIDKYKKSLNYYMESQDAKQRDVFQQMKYT